MAVRPLRLVLLGASALGLGAAAALVAPVAAVEPLVAAAPQGSGQVLSAAEATPPPPATAEATPVPTAAPTAAPKPVPPAPRNRLVSADGGLDTGVGVYSDCSGSTEVPHSEADVDTCVGGRTYFVGHNPGVFTPLMSETVGSVITWYDGGGAAHPLRIVARRDWARSDGAPPMVSGSVVAQFQTCLVADGSRDLILDAVPA